MEIDFQDGSRGGHVGFPIKTILAIFYLQINPFRVYWPFDRGKVFRNGPPNSSWGSHLGFPI